MMYMYTVGRLFSDVYSDHFLRELLEWGSLIISQISCYTNLALYHDEFHLVKVKLMPDWYNKEET